MTTTSMLRRALLLLLSILVLLAPVSASAAGLPDAGTDGHGHATGPRVPHRLPAGRKVHTFAPRVVDKAHLRASLSQPRIGYSVPGTPGSGPLTYGGGMVWDQGEASLAILWLPPGYTVDAGYADTLNQYWYDLASQNPNQQSPDVFSALTQYYDNFGAGNNYIHPNIYPYTGLYVATDPMPDTCSDPWFPHCVTDAQILQEINAVITRVGWNYGLGNDMFMFLPQGVGENNGPGNAFLHNFCAYHVYNSAGGPGGKEITYAVMPDAAASYPIGNNTWVTCDHGQRPNGTEADATVSTWSHEFNEIFSDPTVGAGWTGPGGENGDQCGWIFGPASGPAGAEYNQTIPGQWGPHNYYTQLEWSNASNGCVPYGT